MTRGILTDVSPYFMMSCCSWDVGHGTCRENTPLHVSRLGGGGRWAVKQTVRTGAALPCNSTLASETRTY